MRCLTSCLLALLPVSAFAQQPTADEEILRAAGLSAVPAALVTFFAERTPTPADQQTITALIRQLGDESFTVREQATTALSQHGPAVTALLRQAVGQRDGDVEIVRRCESILAKLQTGGGGSLTAAARLLAQHKPAGAAAALLNYLPFAGDVCVDEEIRAALVPLALTAGRPDPALVQALQDRSPLRRGAAAEALTRASSADARKAYRPLLTDRDPTVRLRVALAFAERRDKEALPALIAVLGELPRDQVWQAEELLCRLAGEQTPPLPAGAERRQVQAAWADWWTRHGASIDLARLDEGPRLLGFTLIVQIDARTGQGRVLELDARKQVRWQISNLEYPVDAQVLRHDRVLITEYNGHRVSERNFNGDVLWEKRVASPISAQRLPNGQTFIACHNQLLIVDGSGKEVFQHVRGNHDVTAAVRCRDGQFFLVANNGTGVRLDAAGKEIKTFPTGQVYQFAGLDALADGKVLLPQMGAGKVVELDADGKIGWSAPLPQASTAQRLPDGTTLAGSFIAQKIVEFGPNGQLVAEMKPDGRPWKVRRR